MRLALVQFNPLVGDVSGNASRALEMIRRAEAQGADLIVLPELALSGYPPRDLLNQEGFAVAVRDAAHDLAVEIGLGPTVVIGAPWRPRSERGIPLPDASGFDPRSVLTNSLLVMSDAQITHRYDKRLLPTYDVFDEHRYFMPGVRPVALRVKGIPVGLSVCEDLWKGVDVGPEVTAYDRYDRDADPVAELIDAGARLILNPSASPFVLGKRARQRQIITGHVERNAIAIAAVNQVGGDDDLVFDGHAAVYVPGPDRKARLIATGERFVEGIVLADLPEDRDEWGDLATIPDPLDTIEPMRDLFDALTLGVRDYIRKTGFSQAIVGLSGGIDSAVTVTVAAAALGPENVLGVAMPSRYSTEHSVTDAEAIAKNLAIRYVEIPIRESHETVERVMRPAYTDLGFPTEEGITEENVQARLRGLIVMALSNKSGAILLNTGNKSELAVGYCTLYGDMNGGLAVLSDVTKIEVYALARWLNANFEQAGFPCPPIPESTITKPPSAELRANQLDQDTLPPYDQLDQIIERYVEKQEHPRRVVKETGLDPALVARIVRLIDLNEYKRKQMPIGLKVSAIAFGRGRRRPLAQGYRPDKGLT